ncbi:TIR domain-containing protein [Chloroflexota bacterium]
MNIFISYSHNDEEKKDRLMIFLTALQNAGLSVNPWSDDQISAGGNWKEEIQEAMAAADMAILLITTDFLASEFIMNEEVPQLLKRRNEEGLIIFPIIAQYCPWESHDWLKELNLRPKNATPVWRDGGVHVELELKKIANEIVSLSISKNEDQIKVLIKDLDSRLSALESLLAEKGFDVAPQYSPEINEIHQQLGLLHQALKNIREIDTKFESYERDVDILQNKAISLLTDHVGIDFINREEELEKITTNQTNPLLLIEGPAGFGKTFLVQQAKGILENDSWKVIYINFLEFGEEIEVEEFYLHLANILKNNSEQEEPSDTEKVKQFLFGFLSAYGDSIAIILDNADRVKPSAAKEIRDDLLYPVTERRRDKRNFRVIVSGRRLSHWEGGSTKYVGGLNKFKKPIVLSEFNLDVIIDTLQILCRSLESKGAAAPSERELYDLACWNQILTGGHPKSLVKFIKDLYLDMYLNPAPGYFNDQLGLYNKYVLDTYNRVINDLPPKIQSIFPYICLIRTYSNESVDLIFDWVKRNIPEIEIEIEGSDIYRILLSSGLIRFNKEKKFYQDNIIRRVVSTYTRLTKKDLTNQLNNELIAYYKRKIDQDYELLGVDRCQTMILEYLYHKVQKMLSNGNDLETIITDYRDLLRNEVDNLYSLFKERFEVDGEFWFHTRQNIHDQLLADEEFLIGMLVLDNNASIDDIFGPLQDDLGL